MVELIEICGYKIQVHRKANLTEQDHECRYNCNGHKTDCENYTPVEVLDNRYINERAK